MHWHAYGLFLKLEHWRAVSVGRAKYYLSPNMWRERLAWAAGTPPNPPLSEVMERWHASTRLMSVWVPVHYRDAMTKYFLSVSSSPM